MCHARRGDDGAAGSMPVAAQGREILPDNVKPLHYDLTLEPNFEDFSFQGSVKIEYGYPCYPLMNCRTVMLTRR